MLIGTTEGSWEIGGRKYGEANCLGCEIWCSCVSCLIFSAVLFSCAGVDMGKEDAGLM